MKAYYAVILTGVLTFQIVDCETKIHGIDVCRESTGIIAYGGLQRVSNKWIIGQNGCSPDTSALLLRLTETNLKPNAECYATLKISAFQNNTDICGYLKNDCFFMASDGWRVKNSVTSQCAYVFWIPKQTIFPLEVTFLRVSILGGNRSFAITYEYLHDTIPDIVHTITNKDPTTETHPNTKTTPVETHRERHDDVPIGGYIYAVIGIGVLVFIELIIIAIFVVQRHKRRNSTDNVDALLSADPGYEQPMPCSSHDAAFVEPAYEALKNQKSTDNVVALLPSDPGYEQPMPSSSHDAAFVEPAYEAMKNQKSTINLDAPLPADPGYEQPISCSSHNATIVEPAYEKMKNQKSTDNVVALLPSDPGYEQAMPLSRHNAATAESPYEKYEPVENASSGDRLYEN